MFDIHSYHDCIIKNWTLLEFLMYTVTSTTKVQLLIEINIVTLTTKKCCS